MIYTVHGDSFTLDYNRVIINNRLSFCGEPDHAPAKRAESQEETISENILTLHCQKKAMI